MNTENPTIAEVVEFRDQLLKAREDVLDKFFLLEDLLKADADREPEELQDIHDGLKEGDRILRGINEKLADTHRLMLKFEDATFEPAKPAHRMVRLDRIIIAGFVLLIVLAVIAL